MSTTLHRSKTCSGVAYAEAGQGEVLLLLHGVGLRLEAWAPQFEVLQATHRVIAADLPGHGESAPLPRDSQLEDFVAWALALMDQLGVAHFNVAGHSMGALIAGGMAATAPDRVLRVAVISGVYRRSSEARAAVISRACEIGAGKIDPESPLRRWFNDNEYDSRAYCLTKTWLQGVDQEGYATAYNAFATGDNRYAQDWTSVNCPALFLTGTEDPNSTPAMARSMAEATPNGMTHLIKGHRHMVNLTAAQEVNAAIAEWLTK